jgi:hypothetical protein
MRPKQTPGLVSFALRCPGLGELLRYQSMLFAKSIVSSRVERNFANFSRNSAVADQGKPTLACRYGVPDMNREHSGRCYLYHRSRPDKCSCALALDFAM